MLIFPVYGICAIALTGLFFPWIKALQGTSIALFYSASAISQDYFKDFSDWLQLSTEDAERVLSRPFSSLDRRPSHAEQQQQQHLERDKGVHRNSKSLVASDNKPAREFN